MASESKVADILSTISLDDEEYVSLLAKLIGESEFLQDNPPAHVPEETRAARHVIDHLKPFTTEEGGPLTVKLVEFEAGRGNVVMTYPGKTSRCVSFVGSHLDVVPANPETWDRNPFELKVEGDKLYGRGTTDCLGHVALITCLFAKLATLKPDLDITVHAVFIASEEAEAKPGVGVDGLMAAGHLDALKEGPVIWVDCSDSQPCIGTAGAMMWHLKAVGHLAHSGFPHKGINSIELGSEAVKHIQSRFYADFPPHPEEERYKFAAPSSMKPTQLSVAPGGLNQIPPFCTFSGDIRFTPFYKIPDVRAAVERYVAELNADLSVLDTRGPSSRFQITDPDKSGRLELTWGSHFLGGIACSLESDGYKGLCKAVENILGEAKPYSVCGSLPLVDQLQAAGFDVQLIGFGLSAVYHADNEYCQLSDMRNAIKILSNMISLIDTRSV